MSSTPFSTPLPHIYFEAHVTIEPVVGERGELAAKIAAEHGFRMAQLFMKKDRVATEVRSDKDSFMTAVVALDYPLIEQRVKGVVKALQDDGFQVWRYKIESAVIDSRSEDVFDLLTEKQLEPILAA